MQSIRRIAGLALALICAWLVWQGLEGVMILTSRGSPLADALDMIVVWRIAAAGIGLVGGVLAALGLRFGALVALLGTIGFILLAAGFILSGTDSSLWMDEAAGALAMSVVTGFLLFTRRS